MKTQQKFASVLDWFKNHFIMERHHVDRKAYKAHRSAELAKWQNLVA
jgi:hypothetical protein